LVGLATHLEFDQAGAAEMPAIIPGSAGRDAVEG
jgi:hypothetical protein